jgi:hypothetical protein
MNEGSKAQERRREERERAKKAHIYTRGLYVSHFLRRAQEALGASQVKVR